jgi:nitrate/TMAO reductase-like tetraheme cytochrome c subunit
MDKPPKYKEGSPIKVVVAGIKQLLLLLNNWMSIIGIVLFVASLFFLTAFWLYSLAGMSLNRYLESFLVLVVPGFFIFALILIPLGIFLMHRRQLKRGKLPASYDIKVKDWRFKGSLAILMGVTLFVVFPVVSISGYQLYEFTESTEFCGEFCHTVMQPQSVAHARSGHARVPCAECHIGAGADFFVKAKLSGLRQVYAVIADTYQRPIPPAITELRPARDTCEECHWPSKFFGTQYKKTVHFSSNEHNGRREVGILIKTGGADELTGRVEGIHMHMLTAGKVEYIATDDKLQEIPWVRYSKANGEVIVYRKADVPADAPPPSGVTRVVDCMDCHNRGAHHFLSPHAAMSLEFESKRIDVTLPFIMREAVDALIEPYTELEQALVKIEQRLIAFYQTTYPEVWANREAAVRQAVERIQAVYQEHFFPYMKEDWRTYPENVGHQLSPGCFRCHDGLHVNEKGKPINSDCTSCHLFVNSEDGGGMDCLRFGKFRHPNSLSIHDKLLCSTCHGTGKKRSCKDCHKEEEWSALRGEGRFRLSDAGVGDTLSERIGDETERDLLFRLEDNWNEWERTEPFRLEIKNSKDTQDESSPPESPDIGQPTRIEAEEGGKLP